MALNHNGKTPCTSPVARSHMKNITNDGKTFDWPNRNLKLNSPGVHQDKIQNRGTSIKENHKRVSRKSREAPGQGWIRTGAYNHKTGRPEGDITGQGGASLAKPVEKLPPKRGIPH